MFCHCVCSLGFEVLSLCVLLGLEVLLLSAFGLGKMEVAASEALYRSWPSIHHRDGNRIRKNTGTSTLVANNLPLSFSFLWNKTEELAVLTQ